MSYTRSLGSFIIGIVLLETWYVTAGHAQFRRWEAIQYSRVNGLELPELGPHYPSDFLASALLFLAVTLLIVGILGAARAVVQQIGKRQHG
jgi:hypothetical protein